MLIGFSIPSSYWAHGNPMKPIESQSSRSRDALVTSSAWLRLGWRVFLRGQFFGKWIKILGVTVKSRTNHGKKRTPVRISPAKNGENNKKHLCTHVDLNHLPVDQATNNQQPTNNNQQTTTNNPTTQQPNNPKTQQQQQQQEEEEEESGEKTTPNHHHFVGQFIPAGNHPSSWPRKISDYSSDIS